jgi:hypothetical protein
MQKISRLERRIDAGDLATAAAIAMATKAIAAKGRTRKVGRNDLCPCGSQLKFKRCCMKRLERERRQDKLRVSGVAIS